jgi:hypothetical protein
MDSSSRFQMLQYLMEQDFMPQDEGAWFDRREGNRITRVVWDGEEESQVIALTPRGVCLYKAMFSPGTPDSVITAVIEAALAEAQSAQAGHPEQSPHRSRPGAASTALSPSSRGPGRDDDR